MSAITVSFEISKDSRDHSREVYEEVIMPGFRKMNPAPKIALTRFGAGVHSFWKAEKDLPVGIVPPVLRTWNDAVVGVISSDNGQDFPKSVIPACFQRESRACCFLAPRRALRARTWPSLIMDEDR